MLARSLLAVAWISTQTRNENTRVDVKVHWKPPKWLGRERGLRERRITLSSAKLGQILGVLALTQQVLLAPAFLSDPASPGAWPECTGNHLVARWKLLSFTLQSGSILPISLTGTEPSSHTLCGEPGLSQSCARSSRWCLCVACLVCSGRCGSCKLTGAHSR